jgi:hypothetical protein
MAATRIMEAIMEATRTTAVPITAYGYYPYGYIGSYYVRITRTIPTALSTVATTDRLLLRAYRNASPAPAIMAVESMA